MKKNKRGGEEKKLKLFFSRNRIRRGRRRRRNVKFSREKTRNKCNSST
jgi:hypothetical protein